jgi:hypothetical protein
LDHGSYPDLAGLKSRGEDGTWGHVAGSLPRPIIATSFPAGAFGARTPDRTSRETNEAERGFPPAYIAAPYEHIPPR